MGRSYQRNTNRIFRSFAHKASKNDRGRGCTTERSRMVHTFPFSFFIFFLLFFDFLSFFIFSFVYCVLILSVAVVFFVISLFSQSLSSRVEFVLSAFICVLSRLNCFLV